MVGNAFCMVLKFEVSIGRGGSYITFFVNSEGVYTHPSQGSGWVEGKVAEANFVSRVM
jgi:hypothetical protein